MRYRGRADAVPGCLPCRYICDSPEHVELELLCQLRVVMLPLDAFGTVGRRCEVIVDESAW